MIRGKEDKGRTKKNYLGEGWDIGFRKGAKYGAPGRSKG